MKCDVGIKPLEQASFEQLHAGAFALNFWDWLQTRGSVNNPNRYENNPMLPRHPEYRDVNGYFLKAQSLLVGVSYALPRKWGKCLVKSVVIGQTGNTLRNWKIGFRARF